MRRQRCTLQILLWDGGTAWNLAFEEPVHSYKFGKSSGKRVLQAEHDFATGRVTRPANLTFRLEKNAIVPAP